MMSALWPQVVDLFTRLGVSAILNGLWESVALALLAWLALRALPGANASIRYALWCAALVGVLALPLVALLHAGAPGAAAAAPIALPERLAQVLLVVWYSVATILVLRLVVSYARLQSLKATAVPLPLFYQHRARRWLEACGGRRACRLCISDQVDVPLAVGLLDPVVVLPARLVAQLSDEELDQIGLHEMAHLQRWDDYTNVFQKLVEALLFFNPAVYLIGRQLMLEREIACDDRVIAATGKPVTYAACLTRLVETSGLARPALPALGALSSRRQFALRIERLLGKRTGVPALTGRLAVAAAVLTIGGALLAATRVSPLVAVSIAADGRINSTASQSAVVASADRTDSTVPAASEAATLALRPAQLIDIVVIEPRHAAAHAAAMASAHHHMVVIHRMVAEVQRIVHVARSNAVGTRNFTPSSLGAVQVEIIAAPIRKVSSSGQVKIRVDDVMASADATAPLANATAASAEVAGASAEAAAASADAAAAQGHNLEIVALGRELRATRSLAAQLAIIQTLSRHLDEVEARMAVANAMLNSASVAVKLSAVEALSHQVSRADTQCALIGALQSDQPVSVQMAAAQALAPVASAPQVRAALEEAAGGAPSDAVRATVQQALSQERNQ